MRRQVDMTAEIKAQEIFMLSKTCRLNCQEKLSFTKYDKEKELGI